jgi:phosphohistidine phosphatase
MKALLIRHAHAVDGGQGTTGDFSRWLTDKGRTVARKVGRRLHDDGIVPDVIVSSPLPRALQTAELVAAALGYRGVVEILPELAPDEPVELAAEALERRGGFVAAVGHEPGISALAGRLVGKSVGAFRKGQAMLVVEAGDRGGSMKVGYRLDPDAL